MAKQQSIVVEAESLEEVRILVKSQIPEGLRLLSENVISDGKPKTVKAVADTTEEAFAKAQGGIPANAKALEKKELVTPEQKAVMVEAFDEQSAKARVASQIGNTVVVKAIKLNSAGKKGFLGIGKKPNQYEVEVFQQAVVEITYKTKAKISAEVGMTPQDRRLQTKRDGKYYCQACGEKKASRMTWGWFCDESCQGSYGTRLYRGSGGKYCQWCGSQLGLTAQNCNQCGELQENYSP